MAVLQQKEDVHLKSIGVHVNPSTLAIRGNIPQRIDLEKVQWGITITVVVVVVIIDDYGIKTRRNKSVDNGYNVGEEDDSWDTLY